MIRNALKLCLLIYACLAFSVGFAEVAQENLSCPIVPATGQPACDLSNDVGSSSPDSSNTVHVGNPVDVVSGNKYQSGLDVKLGDSALSFVRHYNSSLSDINIGLGNGWRHTFSVTLTKSGTHTVTIVQSDGRLIEFTSDGEVFAASDPDDGYVLSQHNGRYSWFLPDGRRLEFYGSFLVAIAMPNGEKLTLLYRQSKLASVSNQSGKTLEFEYGKNSVGLPVYTPDQGGRIFPDHLWKIKIPDGSTIEYLYDERQNLSVINYPRGSSVNRSVHYRYQNEASPHLLTERADARGAIQGRWVYDEHRRVIEYWSRLYIQPDGSVNGKPNLSLAFSATEDGTSGTTRVETRRGIVSNYSWLLDSAGAITSLTMTGETNASAANTNNVQTNNSVETRASLVEPVQYLPFHGPAELTVVSTDELGYPNLVDYKGQFGSTSHTFDVEYDLSGRLLNTQWLNGPLVDDEQERQYDSAELDALTDVHIAGEPLSVEILSKLTQVGHYEASVRSLLNKANEELSVGSQIYGDGWVGLEASTAQKENDQNTYTPEITSYDGETQGNGVCADPLQDCETLLRARDYAELSDCVYLDRECTTRFLEADLSDLGLELKDLSFGSFRAEVYFDSEQNEYFVAFAGTRTAADWIDNIGQELGVAMPQYQRAVWLAQQLQRNNPEKTFSFTGHSLGGGLATAAAAAVGEDATVFNPAALDFDTASLLSADYNHALSNTNIFSVNRELLRELQNGIPFANQPPGRVYDLPMPSYSWISQNVNTLGSNLTYPLRLSYLLHSRDAIDQSLQELIERNHCKP